MEFGDGQSERVDGLELRKDAGLIAYLFGIQVVGHTQQPMLHPGLTRVPLGIELVYGDESRSTSHSCPLNRLLGHRSDRDVLDLYFALLNLTAHHLRDQVILVVLSQTLASQLMGQDNQNHLVSEVVGGQVEQSEVEVKNVTITTMSEETVQGATIARGTALVTIDKLYSQRNSREPRTEHWLLSVTYYLNPKQVSDQARIFPQFETINPLGLTITEFHENRMSVDPIASGTSSPVASPATQSTVGGPR